MRPGKRAFVRATAGSVVLPPAGRRGPAPAWPLAPDARPAALLDQARCAVRRLRRQAAKRPDDRHLVAELLAARLTARSRALAIRRRKAEELELWRGLWATAQAVMWDRLHVERSVASYVRVELKARGDDSRASQEARIRANDLGLTPIGMQRLRWTIGPELAIVEPLRATDRSTSARARRGPLVERPAPAVAHA